MYLQDRLKITSARTYTDEGFLIVPARISRVGIQNYLASEMGLTDRDPKDIIKVYRSQEEVFSEDSLKSFTNKPITDNHPPELINASNSKTYSVGHSGPEVTRDGDFAETILHITDADAISKIESGKVELSNGYIADIEWTPGVSPEGEQYDALQRKIKGNHIAIVERGRAGSQCRVADNLPTEGDKVNMAKITIDGVDFEVTDQAAQAVGKLQARLTDAEEKALTEEEAAKLKKDEEEEKAKEAKKSEDSLKAKLDDAISKIPTSDSIDKLVEQRTSFIDTLLKISPDIDWKGKDENTLRAEVVGTQYPNIQMDSVSKDYIEARFDLLVENVDTNSQHNLDKSFSDEVSKDKTTDNRSASVVARDKMMEDSQNAWKGDKK